MFAIVYKPTLWVYYFHEGYYMLTLESLFPILNLTTPSHDDEFCLFGESDNKVYFVSKLDTTIIIYDNLNVNLLTFIDNVLVDKRRLLRKSDTIVKQKDLEFLPRFCKKKAP